MLCSCDGPVDGEKWMFCKRHGVYKTKHFVDLCLRDQAKSLNAGRTLGHWANWEAGKGLGQNKIYPQQTSDKSHKHTTKKQDLPPTRKQVVNFLTSMLEFAGDGFKLVDDKEFNNRVAVCKKCKFFNSNSGRCSICGCYGKLKARGKVWKCPKNMW